VSDGGESAADDDRGPSVGLQPDGVVWTLGLLDDAVQLDDLCSIRFWGMVREGEEARLIEELLGVPLDGVSASAPSGLSLHSSPV